MILNQMRCKNRLHIHFIWIFNLYAFLIFGCAAGISGTTKEPGILIVRNNSGVGILSVTLKATGSPDRKNGRYGTISPVPLGASQVYVRPASAPPLPKKLLISWVTDKSISHVREISLAQAAKFSPDQEGNAMVFEILPGEIVNVYYEVVSDSRSKYELEQRYK